MRVVFLPSADADLEEIHEWIAARDQDAADRLIDEIRDATWRLALYPESAEPSPRSGRSVRKLTVGNYGLYYRVAGDEVRVLRIIHARRRQPRLR